MSSLFLLVRIRQTDKEWLEGDIDDEEWHEGEPGRGGDEFYACVMIIGRC